MLKALYDAIRRDAAPTELELNGRVYTDKQVYPVKAPEPSALSLTTLTGVVDYLTTNKDNLNMAEIFCHVVSPAYVCVCSSLLPPFLNRAYYVEAKPNQIELPFNKWIDAEPFNIALQACFVEGGDSKTVLKFISDVVAVTEAATSDDGTTQAVAVKAGITSKAVKALPNPVTLRPYRTFTEVEQPASKFVFRVRQEGGKMQYLLAEADGGAWRSEAMKNIQTFMEKAVQGLNVIA